MSLEHLTMEIAYDIKKSTFKISSDMKEKAYPEIIEGFIRSQIGAGRDTSKPNELDVYHITLKWYPEDDTITASSDTGNKGLREGILLDVLKQLEGHK